jgi:hypothetical protein
MPEMTPGLGHALTDNAQSVREESANAPSFREACGAGPV